jgi:DNA-binding response OmpR family regulator
MIIIIVEKKQLMKKRVLVADDDTAILEVIKIILEDKGYEVITIENAAAVPQKIRQHSPHIILLDIWMSGYDGREVAKSLRKDKETQHIPIILVSAHNDTQKMAKESEVDDYLEKPFAIDDLVAKIEKNIKK